MFRELTPEGRPAFVRDLGVIFKELSPEERSMLFREFPSEELADGEGGVISKSLAPETSETSEAPERKASVEATKQALITSEVPCQLHLNCSFVELFVFHSFWL